MVSLAHRSYFQWGFLKFRSQSPTGVTIFGFIISSGTDNLFKITCIQFELKRLHSTCPLLCLNSNTFLVFQMGYLNRRKPNYGQYFWWHFIQFCSNSVALKHFLSTCLTNLFPLTAVTTFASKL